MTRRSQSRSRRSRSYRPRHRSPSPIPRARRRSHRSRSPPTHRRHGSPPPPSTPTQSTNLPPLPRLRRRHSTPAPTRRPDPRRSRSLSRRRPPHPRSPRPYRSPATFTTPRPVEHHPTHRPRQPDQRRPHLTHTSPDISSDTAPRRSWLHSRPTITLKPNPHTSQSITPRLPPPRCPAPPAQYTLHQPPPDTHINPPPPPSRPPHPATPRSTNPASTHLTLPSNYQRMDFPINHMLTQHFPPNQLPSSDTPSPPLPLPEIRQSMSIPNYKQLQETLTTAQQRANWLAPHWQLYQNLSIQHPTTQALDEAHLPNQEMLPDSAQEYLARAMATTGFPFSSIKSISHHTYQNKNIWRVALTKLPGSLQPQSMLSGVYKYAHATSQSGIIGFLLLGCILPSCKDILGVDFTPTGFFCSATLDPTPDALLKIVVNRSQSAKNSGSFIITGDVIGCHAVVDSGGVYDEQKTVQHSSPIGARTNGGASTMNTITPLIFGLSILIRSPPLQLHMQKHHPTPNQNFQGPPSTYNPHHHTLPFLSKSPTQPYHQTTSNHTQNQTCGDILEDYSTAAGTSTEATWSNMNVP